MGQKNDLFFVHIEANGRSYIIKSKEQHVTIPSDSSYTLRLSNMSTVRCDVSISIGGYSVGTWRLNSKESLTLSQYPTTSKLFKLMSSSDTIQVEFRPESNKRVAHTIGCDSMVMEQSEGRTRYTRCLNEGSIDWTSARNVSIRLGMG